VKGLLNYKSPVVGLLSRDFSEPDVLAFAREKYPFINQYDPRVKISPRPNSPYYAETFKPGEEGSPEAPRPSEFPLSSLGVEIYKPGNAFTSDDYAAEFLHGDGRANQARSDIMKTLTRRQTGILKDQPDYADDGGLSEQKRMENATDALLRGYTVGQWPKAAIEDFGLSLNQTLVLDALKKYMTGR
jgi:hypothetical protein